MRLKRLGGLCAVLCILFTSNANALFESRKLEASWCNEQALRQTVIYIDDQMMVDGKFDWVTKIVAETNFTGQIGFDFIDNPDDGLRCIDGSLVRLGTKTNVSGAAQYPEAGNVSISVRGQTPVGSGAIGYYQTYYRNAAVFCTSSTFNVTNAVRVVW